MVFLGLSGSHLFLCLRLFPLFLLLFYRNPMILGSADSCVVVVDGSGKGDVALLCVVSQSGLGGPGRLVSFPASR